MKFVILASLVLNVAVLSGCGGGSSNGSSQMPAQADVDNQGNCSQNLMADINRMNAVQSQSQYALTQSNLQGYQANQAPGTYGLVQGNSNNTNLLPNGQLSQIQQLVAACDTFFAKHSAAVSCKVPAPAGGTQTTQTQMVMPQGSTLRISDLKQQCDMQRTAYAQQLNSGTSLGQIQNQPIGQQSTAPVNSQAGTLNTTAIAQTQSAVPPQNQIITASSPATGTSTANGDEVKATHKKKHRHSLKATSIATASGAAASCAVPSVPANPAATPLSSLKSCELIVTVGDVSQIYSAYTRDSLISGGSLKTAAEVQSQEDTCSLISIDGGGSSVTETESLVVASKTEVGLSGNKTQLTLTFAGKSLGIQCVKNGLGFTKQDLDRILGQKMFNVNVVRIN